MGIFGNYMSLILQAFRYPITVYGFTFSLWHVFLFTLFGSIVVGFLGDLLSLR
mgnify:CR=1 FL=1